MPWRMCVARRDPARMHAHTRGGGTRAVCLALGYRARQTYGLHHSAAGGGGTSKVNQYADRGGPPTVNQCTACGGTQDPVRGQSLVAGDAIPGRVVRWVMSAAQVSIAMEYATCRREMQWRDLRFLIVPDRGNSQLFADFLRQNVIYVVVEWDDSIQ